MYNLNNSIGDDIFRNDENENCSLICWIIVWICVIFVLSLTVWFMYLMFYILLCDKKRNLRDINGEKIRLISC